MGMLTYRKVKVDQHLTIQEGKVNEEIERAIRLRKAASSQEIFDTEEFYVPQDEELLEKDHIFLTSDVWDYRQYWILEREDATDGGQLSFNERFFLKSCLTGLYVTKAGIMELCPNREFAFVIPKPATLPEDSPVPYKYSLIINASDRTSRQDGLRKPVLVPEDKSREEDCMPMVVPTNHVIQNGEQVLFEVPVIVTTTNKDNNLELFEVLPMKNDPEFMLRLARLMPLCSNCKQLLSFWIQMQEDKSQTEIEVSGERLTNSLTNFTSTLATISRMIKDSHTPEQYENKQCTVVGVGLHAALIDIAEIIFLNTQKIDTLARSLYHTATKKPFQQIWSVLIQVASENFFCCKLLEMDKERICTMVVREKKRIGQLLTEIYRVVDPDMPNYAEDFAGWCRRLETLSENNIDEQTIFINLIHCLCEVGENVKIEYQREIVHLLFDSENAFPILRIMRGESDQFFVQFFTRNNDGIDKLVEANPKLHPDPLYFSQGIFCVSLDSLVLLDSYIEYVFTAMVLMNTLCKGPFEEGRERVERVVQITADLVIVLIRHTNTHLKILEGCLNLADTLIAKREKPTFAPVKDEDDQCFINTELSQEDTSAFQDRQLRLRSNAINECIRQTVNFLCNRKYPPKMESSRFSHQLEYIQAVLNLTFSLLENGHYSMHEIRRVYNVIGYFLVGMCGGAEAEEQRDKHWAVGLLANNIKLNELSKNAELEMKLQVNELFSVLVRLLYTTNNVVAREKVKRLLAYCKSSQFYTSETILSLLKAEDRSIQVSGVMENDLQQHLLSMKSRPREKKYPPANQYMFRLVLNWSAIHSSLKETVISLLEQLFNEKACIQKMLWNAEVLHDTELAKIYDEFREMKNSIDLPAVLQETKRSLLTNVLAPENSEIEKLHEMVTRVADSICPRRGSAAELPVEIVQNIVRSVGLHQHFLHIFNFCTQFPLDLDLVHPQMLRLKVALSSFYFYFVKDNPTNRQAMLNILQKHHYFVLIPRYCDFIRELNDFEHMTNSELSRFYYYILFNYIGESGPKIRLNGLYFLKAMMFDKARKPIPDRQNKIARYVTELTREDHITNIKDPCITAALLELLSLSAIDNEPITVLCGSILSLQSMERLTQRPEPVLHHALLHFMHFVYARASKVERNVQKQSPVLLTLAKRILDILEPVFMRKVDVIALGISGKYEQILPVEHPALVEEGTTLDPFDPDACLMRLLSSGSQWDIKGGIASIFPQMLRYILPSRSTTAFITSVSDRLSDYKSYLESLQIYHSELNFAPLISSLKASVNNLKNVLPENKESFGVLSFASLFQKKDLFTPTSAGKGKEGGKITTFGAQRRLFFDSFEEAIDEDGAADSYLHEMVKVFNSVSFGKDEILEKVPKDKLEAMTKVLRRLKKLFVDTRHRSLYFQFLAEIIPNGETEKDLLKKYTLNSVFKESRILSEAINTLLRCEGKSEVIAVYDFLNKLLDRQNKEFMDEFREMIDSSEKSYRLFYLIKTEMDYVKQKIDLAASATTLTKLRGSQEFEEPITELREKALTKALMFLQLCCDNCNIEFQEYMSSQKTQEGQASLDLVSEVAQFVVDLVRGVGTELLEKETFGEMMIRALAALLDFVTGPCQKNQNSLGENIQLFLAINDLMELTQNAEPNETTNQIHEKIMIFMHTLLEGDPPTIIYDNMLAYLSLKNMRQGLELFYANHVRTDRDQFELERIDDELLKQKLDIFILQAILLVKLKKHNETNPELKKFAYNADDPDDAYNFYAAYIGYVEIGKRDGTVQANYFPVPFKCKFLTPASRKSIIYDIDRSSHQKKIEEFVRWMPIANREMKHQQTLSAFKTMKSISSKWKVYAKLSFFVVLIINLQLLFSLEESLEETEITNPMAMFWVKIFGVIQILLYIACVLFLVIEYYPAYFQREETYSSIEFDQYYRVPFNESQNTKNVQKKTKSGKTKPSTIELSLREIGTSLGLYYHYIYFLISIMAIYDPLMYPFLLLDLIKQNEELVNVLKSITLNLRQLILTMIFGLIIIFLFSVYSFVFFQKDYSPEDSLYCGDLWNCFASTLNLGTRSGGGIGDALSPPSEGYRAERMIFDMLFFLVIIIIFLNIIFGIIIDTFAQLRDSRKQVLEDINNVCYVCGTERSVIDLHGKWSYHFMCEHSPLAYLAFLIYVTEKEMQDCSGVEKYVKEKLSKNDTSFMPTTFKSFQDRKSSLSS